MGAYFSRITHRSFPSTVSPPEHECCPHVSPLSSVYRLPIRALLLLLRLTVLPKPIIPACPIGDRTLHSCVDQKSYLLTYFILRSFEFPQDRILSSIRTFS